MKQMNESSHGVAFKGHSRSGRYSWAGVFLSLRKEGIKETCNVISLTDAGWCVCRFTGWFWWYWLVLSILASQAFTGRTVVSQGGARKVLGWGEGPTPGSLGGDASPSSSWNGAQCPDSASRTQVLEWDTTSIAPQSLCHEFSSVAWNVFPTALTYKLHAFIGRPRDLSPPAHALSEIKTPSLQL